jgi:MFS family permease
VPTRKDPLLWISFGCFIGLGMAGATLGPVWPHMRASLGLPLGALGLLLLLGTVASTVSGIAMGRLTRRFGSFPVVAAAIAGLGVALLVQGLSPAWPVTMLSGLFYGLFEAPIDAGLQALTAVRRGVRAMSLLHASYGLGAVLGPLVLTGLLLEAFSWRVDYVVLAGVQGILLLLVLLTRRIWPRDSAEAARANTDEMQAAGTSERASPPRQEFTTAFLVVALFFVDTGLEISAGQWAASYFVNGTAVGIGLAGVLVSCYWGGLSAARLAAGVVGHRISPARLLDLSLVTTALGVLAFSLFSNVIQQAVGLVLMGVGLASIFPVLMQLTPARTGAAGTASAIGYQTAAGALGASLIPGGMGVVLQQWGLGLLGPLLAGLAALLILLRVLAGGRLAGTSAPAPRSASG